MKKEQIQNQVLYSVLSAEVTKGHLKWKVSEIARSAHISRPLIYYHFGKTKKEILSACLEKFGHEYFGFSEAREQMLREGRLFESLLLTRKIYSSHPALAIFYQKYRGKNLEISQQLLGFEKKYEKKLKAACPHLSDAGIEGLHALFHGLVVAPFLSSEGLAAAVQMLQGILAPRKD